jgi:asparagine synthase (glutamine-hydrolysing)
MELPFAEPVASLVDYVETLAPDPPAYFAGPSPRATLAARLARRADGGVDSHGVAYPSFRAFLEHHELYPFTNHRNYLFYGELCHVAPHFTPFLDRRFVDLSLRTPRRHKLRRNVVDRALARVASDLAAVPHANRSVPLDWPFPAQWVGYHLTGLYRKLPVRGGEPHFSRGPWPDHPALLRADPFVDDLLAADGDALDRAPFLDRAGARRCLRAHRDGANEHDALYALAVFLGHPATARLLGPDAMGSS